MDNKLLMVSLDKVKDIAEVLSNDTARLILNFLADEKDVTESQMAKRLNIPMPTVHYNLQKLISTGLVITELFNYSKKGRKVSYYRLANKHIIISPKPVKGILRKLKGILPAFLTVIGIGAVIELLNKTPPPVLTGTRDAVMFAAPAASAVQLPVHWGFLFIGFGTAALLILAAFRIFRKE